jgi:hypothetical protein
MAPHIVALALTTASTRTSTSADAPKPLNYAGRLNKGEDLG